MVFEEEGQVFKLRPKVGSLGSVENHIAQQVVAARSVAARAADQRVVTIPVQHPITEEAFNVTLGETCPQPASEHPDE